MTAWGQIRKPPPVRGVSACLPGADGGSCEYFRKQTGKFEGDALRKFYDITLNLMTCFQRFAWPIGSNDGWSS
jgi:hypothetical protein